jgi:HEAT repeat protein
MKIRARSLVLLCGLIASLLLFFVILRKNYLRKEHWITLAQRNDPGAIHGAIEDLLHGTPDTRTFAAAYLGNMGTKAAPAVPSLVSTLDDPDPKIRSAAAYALGGIGADAESAVPKLVTHLSDQDPDVRAASAQALGLIGPGAQDARPALIEARDDREASVREAARFALEMLSRWVLPLNKEMKQQVRAQIPKCIEMLRSDNSTERYANAAILGQMGPEARMAVPSLLQLLADERAFVRRAAAKALTQIDPDRYQQH